MRPLFRTLLSVCLIASLLLQSVLAHACMMTQKAQQHESPPATQSQAVNNGGHCHSDASVKVDITASVSADNTNSDQTKLCCDQCDSGHCGKLPVMNSAALQSSVITNQLAFDPVEYALVELTHPPLEFPPINL